jgi:D-sedoheptulose 7-phosphate isomerase
MNAWADRIVSQARLLELRAAYRAAGKRVVSTNGVFDLLHPGHIAFLTAARALGDVLVVGLNGDAGVRRLKGAGRPLLSQDERALMLAALRPVDHVTVFDEDTPTAWLAALQPDIHCKAADYSAEALPEAEVVRRGGGEIRILPLREGISTSQLVERILLSTRQEEATAGGTATLSEGYVLAELLRGSNVLRQTAYRLSREIVAAAECLVATLRRGGKVLLCGNGGSAADAQHIAAELVVRFRRHRLALPALALTTDTSILTAAGNDYGFEHIFARQVEAWGRPGDVLVAISTSGRSANVLRAVATAHSLGLFVIGLTGGSSAPLHAQADLVLAVPAAETALIQQAHTAILHLLCDLVEQQFLVAEAR